MTREYSYRISTKIVWIFIGGLTAFLPIPLLLMSLYLHFYKDVELISVMIMALTTLFLVPTGLLGTYVSLKTRLLINREGLELKTPLVLLTVGWEDMQIVAASDRLGKYIALYSTEMEVQRIGLGHYIPGSVDKDTLGNGIPISRFLGNDRAEIVRTLRSFRYQQTKENTPNM